MMIIIETVSMPAASHSAFIHLTSSLKRFLIDDKQQNPRLAVSYFISKPSFSLSLFHFNPFSIHSIFVSFHLYIFTAHLSLLPAAMWGSLLSSFKYPLRLSWSTWKHFLLFFALSYIHIQVASQALLVHLKTFCDRSGFFLLQRYYLKSPSHINWNCHLIQDWPHKLLVFKPEQICETLWLQRL